MKHSLTTEFTKRTWGTIEAKQFLSTYKSEPLYITMYSSLPLRISKSDKTYATVTDPHSSFIALENLRLIKDIVINSSPRIKEWKERSLHNSNIANSANASVLMEDSLVKRLLLNQKNCGNM